MNGAGAAIQISPTSSGTVTINPNGASTMNNVAIGGTTPLAGTFTDFRVNNTISLAGSTGTAGYLIQSNGASAPTWVNPASLTVSAAATATNATNAANVAIIDDTTTATTVYPVWANSTSGNQALETSSTKLSFVPSTGTLSATVFSGAGTSLTGTASSLTAGAVANALTIGTGLTLSSGTTFNGSAAVTLNATGSTINSQTTGYTLVAADAGKTISITTGGVTIPNAVMSAGNIITIYNNSGSSQTITQGASLTLQWAGQSSSTTGNRTLGLYGIATIIFISSSVAVISGAGLT
jgi:hypothetical protein